ncbi:MAG: anti-sigma factor antagonist [Eubacterium sp.]
MNVTIEASGNLMVAYLIGELDHHTAGAVREKIDNAISFKKPNHLILDFKNITFMDSSGIGLVMGRYRLMQGHRGSVEIRNVNQQTKKIMELAGLGRIAVINELKEQ